MAVNSHSIDLEASSSQYLSRADNATLSITGNMTLECWINIESLPSLGTAYGIISKTGDPPDFGYRLDLLNSGGSYYLQLELSSNGTATTAKNRTYAFTTATWTHVACVYTAASGGVEFFVNGVSIGTQTGLPTSIFDSTAAFNVGAVTSTRNFDGKIDDVRVWSSIRTVTEIAAQMIPTLTGAESGLLGWWQLNNALTDSTANAQTLTNNGSAVFSTDVPYFFNPFSDTEASTDTVSVVTLATITLSDVQSGTDSVSVDIGWGTQAKSSTSWTTINKS